MSVRKPRRLFAITVAALLPLTALAGQDEFCQGFYRGYYEGYKRASGSIFEPSLPMCPLMPRKGPRDPKDDGEHGYEMGYDQGRDEGQRRFR
jgi:hypothetical protein